MLVMYQDNFVATIKCKGKVLREKKGIVYLPFGSEYSILMKNLATRRALVDVEIDGASVIHGKLIIDANSTLELERYVKNLTVGNKFKFIEKTDQISEYRGDRVDDGVVRVVYQFEQPTKTWTTQTTIYHKKCPYNATHCVYPHRYSCLGCEYYRKYESPYVPWTQWNYTTDSSPDIVVGSEVNYQSSLNYGDTTVNCCFSEREEGITVPGEQSNQVFIEGNIGTVEAEKHVITLQLRGSTTKEEKVIEPVTIKTKIMCITCGSSNNSRFNYCVECGTALNIY